MSGIKEYYQSFKPERTLANVMTTAAGFLLASELHPAAGLLIATLVGTSLMVASACAVNNVIDRDLDARMPRTKHRALSTGTISPRIVAWLAGMFGLSGFGLLLYEVNMLTAFIGVVGYLDYVVLYGWAKRHTKHSTLVGTVSGAAPLVAGYTAVTGSFDWVVLLLALVMIFWQMAHFFAIAVYRRQDYLAGALPVYTVADSVERTKCLIVGYVSLVIVAVLGLGLVGALPIVGLTILIPLCFRWLWMAFDATVSSNEVWGRNMFGFSLVVLLLLCALLPFGKAMS